jgi:hypothetical protein
VPSIPFRPFISAVKMNSNEYPFLEFILSLHSRSLTPSVVKQEPFTQEEFHLIHLYVVKSTSLEHKEVIFCLSILTGRNNFLYLHNVQYIYILQYDWDSQGLPPLAMLLSLLSVSKLFIMT